MQWYNKLNWTLGCLIPFIMLLQGCGPSGSAVNGDSLALRDALASDLTGNYIRVHSPRNFDFPRDHAAHPEYRQEWWYFTGNVESNQGHRYGYELTIFRVALNPPTQDAATSNVAMSGAAKHASDISSWRTNHIYMAHLAITDIDNKKFYYTEQFSRDAMGLAGAGIFFKERLEGDATQLRVWINNWSIESIGDTVFPLQLSAVTDDFSINLVLNKSKPIVLQGENGLSVKGDNPGNASYYYSITRMETIGSITIGNEKASVTGNSWFDREWSTSQLEPEQEGWDWFALQLDDNREIMFYSLRRKDGSLDIHSAGTIVDANGSSKRLAMNDVRIEVIRQWKSRHSNVTYPAGWKISIPSESLDLQVTPAISDQELNTTVRYWEGAVKVSGKYGSGNRIVAGKGYVELAGYKAD